MSNQLDWIFDLPSWQLGAATVLLFTLVVVVVLYLTRTWIYRYFRISDDTNDAVNGYFAAVGVFFGLLLGLVSVASWESYEGVEDIISNEVATTAALYRDVSALQQPAKMKLQKELENYLGYVIRVAWPAHRVGEVPTGGTQILSRFHATLAAYEPATTGQQILMTEALSEFNELIEARRARLDAVSTRIPDVFWFVIMAGTVLMTLMSFFFHISSLRTHLVLTGIFSAFLGSLIYLLISVDSPFRGEISVSSEPYQNLLKGIHDLDPGKINIK